MGDMKVDIIRSLSEFEALADEWNELLVNSDANSIFLSWEWMISWLKVHSDKDIIVITVRNDSGRLTGVAPYYIAVMRFVMLIKYKTLRAIGDIESGAEYPDWIVRKGEEERALECIMNALLSVRSVWDCIWMPRMAGWSGASSRMRYFCSGGGLPFHERPHIFSGFVLPISASKFQLKLSKNRKQQLKRQTKKIFHSEKVSVVGCNDDMGLDRLLNDLFELNKKRWNEVGCKGTFEKKPREANFYRNFVPEAQKKGWLLLMGIADGRDVKAIQIGYLYNSHFHQIQEGFDPNYTAGAGNVLRLKIIEHCIELKAEYYDFLGGYSEHKRRWGAVKREGFDIFIGNGSLKSRILFLFEVWPSGKYLNFLP